VLFDIYLQTKTCRFFSTVRQLFQRLFLFLFQPPWNCLITSFVYSQSCINCDPAALQLRQNSDDAATPSCRGRVQPSWRQTRLVKKNDQCPAAFQDTAENLKDGRAITHQLLSMQLAVSSATHIRCRCCCWSGCMDTRIAAPMWCSASMPSSMSPGLRDYGARLVHQRRWSGASAAPVCCLPPVADWLAWNDLPTSSTDGNKTRHEIVWCRRKRTMFAYAILGVCLCVRLCFRLHVGIYIYNIYIYIYIQYNTVLPRVSAVCSIEYIIL